MRKAGLLDEKSLLHVQGYTFNEIIVHCGTDYAGADYNEYEVAVEIKDLFGALNQMFPLTTLHFPKSFHAQTSRSTAWRTLSR